MLEDILKEYNATEVVDIEVYRDIFRLGEGYIQHFKKESHNLTANPLGLMFLNGGQKRKFRVLFEDTFEETLRELQEADFSIMNGITYFGRRSTQEKASKMFCMIFDIDGVTEKTLNDFLYGAFNNIYPIPNYIALSGSGLHLYYLFEEPLPLYPISKFS